MKKVGVITFHNSYNCGSMLESFAIQEVIKKMGADVKIINFSNSGQKALYGIWHKNNSFKNVIRNILLIPAYKKIVRNNEMYEKFKNEHFILTKSYSSINELNDKRFDVVVAGSDQIWNVTIMDSDDAYFLPWVKNAKKVAYAPSFGSKNILKCSNEPEKYIKYLKDFDAISIREKNGQKWIKDMINKNVPILLDPTLLLEQNDYNKLLAKDININYKYIFFYSPNFDSNICRFVKKISKKYNLKVVTWSTKSYYRKLIKRFGFILPKYENPSVYLYLIKNASLILTTSYHGTIFSTIYRKKFFTIKNGDMYGDDDRVITLLEQLKMMNRLIPYNFNNCFDYLGQIDYNDYDKNIIELKEKSYDFIKRNVVN